jgi:hypothetical protein
MWEVTFMELSLLLYGLYQEIYMKTNSYKVFGLVALLWMLIMPCGIRETLAGVSVNINIGPPPIMLPAPPEVVMVPGSPVYFVPHLDLDVFFYGGYWWSPRGDRWYRSRAYNGPWRTISRRYVPAPVFRVPRDYRRIYESEPHIPYGQWKHREKMERRQWDEERGGGDERGHGHGRGN